MKRALPLFLILLFVGRNVNAQCNAAFTWTSDLATASFQAANTANNIFQDWRFGDGALGYGASIQHTYSAPGTYIVTHIVVDSLNTCTDSSQQTITINFPVSCSASFTAVQDSFLFSRYHFTSTSTNNGGTIQAYNWSVDGAAVGTGYMFTYDLSPGSHTVCLSISTTAGCSSSSCSTITVTGTGSCNLTASFTTQASTTDPKTISFYPSPSGNSYRYQWSFGDGQNSSLKTPVHTYAQAGNYNIRLAIADTLTGCFDSTVQNLRVYGTVADNCTGTFTYSIDSLQPNLVHFTGISNQSIVSETWYINSMDSSVHEVINGVNPSYTFSDTGYYSVCLHIVTSSSCEVWYCDGVSITSTGRRIANLIPSYPNPTNGSAINLRLTLAQAGRIKFTIYNTSGTIMYVSEKPGAAGMNTIQLPIADLQKGQYFINIEYNNRREKSIFQKL